MGAKRNRNAAREMKRLREEALLSGRIELTGRQVVRRNRPMGRQRVHEEPEL